MVCFIPILNNKDVKKMQSFGSLKHKDYDT